MKLRTNLGCDITLIQIGHGNTRFCEIFKASVTPGKIKRSCHRQNAPKTMSPPPYTTILLHPLCTVSTGLSFLYQRQCPHHHISLFYCIHCIYCILHGYDLFPPKMHHHHIPKIPLHTAYCMCMTFLHQRQCPHHHIPLFHCIHWFDLFAQKTMSSPPYTTILMHKLHPLV